MANKSKRKAPAATSQSKWTSLPWQSVQVGKDTADITDDVDDKVWLSNHYDNPKLRRSDLYEGDSKGLDFVEGANDPGIFLGLEVIDGSQYEVEKVPISSGEEGAETKGFISRLVIKDAFAEFVAEETGRGKSGSQSKALRGKSGSEAKAAAKSKIAKDRESSSTEPAEENTLSRKEKNQLKLEKLKAKRKEIKLKKKRKREEAESEVAATGKIESATTTSSKKKRKSENKISKPGTLAVTEDQMKSIQIPWSIATGGVYLHPKLCKALFRLNFSSPTPIQSSTLAASILGLRDVVGAAPTGSGKTLSYLLPILHHLLTEEDERRKQEDHSTDESFSYPLTALILCPTRELAMQVSTEFSKLVYDIEQDRTSESRSLIQCGTIVGGLSEQKQKRVLDVKRPPVLVGTPGRLWDLMSTGDHDHLLNLKKLRFLVVDEADRMISQGSFPQLKGIFEKMQQANPSLEYMEKHAEDVNDSDSEDEDRMLSLPGIPGEAKVTMLDDNLLKMIERQRTGQDDDSLNSGNDADAPEPIEIDDEEYEKEQARFQEEIERIDQIDDDEVEEEEQAVKRQTFIFSATLTLPSSSDQSIASKPKGKKGKGKQKKGKLSVDGAIAEILETIGAQGQTKIVDLSTSSNKLQNTRISKTKQDPTQKPTVELPPGLSLYEILCTQRHKDSHLYSFLTTTKQGSSGPCLVFCNSIGAVKRVGETLKILGLPVRMLHAQMQQKARLSSLESLSKLNLRAVVVATDVAARGLDIPSVASIVHYDVARATDTFVHRAGRTARGVGEKAIGWSVSLVSAPEERSHKSICRAILGDVKSTFDVAPMDSRLLANASERVNLASKIVACEDAESKTNKSNQWFRKASEEAGLDLDEDLLDDGQLGGSKKERQQFLEAKRARQELKALLAKPMRKQAFGKFLSNAGLRDAIQAENEVKPYVVTEGRQNRKKKRKVDSKVNDAK